MSSTRPFDRSVPPAWWPATVTYLKRGRWVRITHPLGRDHPAWIATAERLKARGFRIAPPSDLDDRDDAAQMPPQLPRTTNSTHPEQGQDQHGNAPDRLADLREVRPD